MFLIYLFFFLFHFTVYVILGNYYEHMGLLMALNDKKLLDNGEKKKIKNIIFKNNFSNDLKK